MIESLAIIAIVALVVVVVRQNSRLGLLEREVGALRSFVLTNPPGAVGAVQAPQAESVQLLQSEPVSVADVASPPSSSSEEGGPWSAAAAEAMPVGEAAS